MIFLLGYLLTGFGVERMMVGSDEDFGIVFKYDLIEIILHTIIGLAWPVAVLAYAFIVIIDHFWG